MTQPRPRRTDGKWYARFRLLVPSTPSGETFGTHAISTGPLGLWPPGVASAEAFGAPRITYPQTIEPAAITSTESFGAAGVAQTLNASGIPSPESFGIPTMRLGAVVVATEGAASAEAFGTSVIGRGVLPPSIPSAEVVGQPIVGRGIGVPGIASAEAVGAQTVARGAVGIAANGIPSAEAFGTAVITQPASVVYSTVGVGAETTATATQCTINPAAGDDVLVFFSQGGGDAVSATYGAGNLPMTSVGQALSNGVLIAAYLIRGVSAGNATITINKTGSRWGQAVAVSYAGAQGYDPATQLVGNGATFSQTVSVPLNGRTVHAFTPGETSTTLSGLTGGVSRYLDNVGFLTQSVRDTDVAGTFAGTLSASRDWAILSVALRAIAPTGVRAKYNVCTPSVLSTTTTADVVAAGGDYIYAVIAQDRPGDPSTVTCAGTAMTLIDTAPWSSPYGASYIKIYRSAASMTSAGAKTLSVTSTGNGWCRIFGITASGVSNPSGVVTKTSGTSSQPVQSATCSVNQMILQVFATSTMPTGTSGGTCLSVTTIGQIFLSVNVAHEPTTFKLANTSVNWGAMALVLS